MVLEICLTCMKNLFHCKKLLIKYKILNGCQCISRAYVLEITLNNGTDPATGTLFKKTSKNIEDCKSIDEVFEEFKVMLKRSNKL